MLFTRAGSKCWQRTPLAQCHLLVGAWCGHFCASRGVQEKKYILIYAGNCFGVGGWERAMAFPVFFFFCTAVGQNCFQGRMIVLLVYIVNLTDDSCIFQLDESKGQPKKYIQCT